MDSNGLRWARMGLDGLRWTQMEARRSDPPFDASVTVPRRAGADGRTVFASKPAEGPSRHHPGFEL